MNLMINYHDHWWYKALTWLLIVAIIIMISIGAAPPARAIGVLTATMAAAILAVLAGAGIYTVVSGMTSAEIQSWLNEKLNEWDTSRNDGNVFSDLIQNNLITATVRGTLGIGAAAASGISNFINWLTTNLSLNNNDLLVVYSSRQALPVYNGTGNFSGALVYSTRINNTNYDIYYASSQPNTYSAYVSNENKIYTINLSYFQLHMKNNLGGGFVYDSYYNNGISMYNVDLSASSNDTFYIPIYSTLQEFILEINDTPTSLNIETGIINIPDTSGDKVIGLEVGAFPGATTDEVTDVILDGVIDNTLDVDMVVTDELVDAQEVYIINEQPLSVNTDHHAFGFQLPEITFDFSSIWHYVTDAVTYASGFISWWVNFFTSVPILTIPLYCAFTLLVVLGAMRRFLL